jgi:hypothetical protein
LFGISIGIILPQSMNRIIRYLIIIALFFPMAGKAQFETIRDSVVQLYGVIMTADSLRAMPAASVIIKGQNRGTMTNSQGVFSIAALKGDVVEFSYVGYLTKEVVIPKNLDKKEYSVIQLMTIDTTYLPATIIRPRPTREQFERDFVNVKIPDDNIEVARKNTDAAKRRILMASLPRDGREAVNYNLQKQAQQLYYKGQAPPMQILNPAAWAEFIQAWKRGDFKRKD